MAKSESCASGWSSNITRSTDGIPPSITGSWGSRKLHQIKICLLICSMFPKYLLFEDLFIFSMGLDLFENVHNLLEVRYWIDNLIQNINNLGVKILVCGEEDEYQYVKLSNSLDSASGIASWYGLIVKHETIMVERPKSSFYQNCHGLSLVLNGIMKYPVSLVSPNLAILQIHYREDSQSLPIEFFLGIKELRVLSLDVPSLPQSLNVLRNLQTLRLKVLTSENMFVIGGLVNLKFLSISTVSLTDIPEEMGQLVNLRLLDLRKMNLAYIPPGVLSRMSKLEELYLPFSFRRWENSAKGEHVDSDEWESKEHDDYDDEGRTIVRLSRINNGERTNASLDELISLPLNALQISIPKASMLPKRSPDVLKNFERFKILVHINPIYQPFGKCSMTELQLGGDAQDIKESRICDLLCRTEELSLTRVENLKNVMYQLEGDGFPQLKKMIITKCDELENLIGTTEKQIGSSSFPNLEILHLSMLSNMKEIWHDTRPIVFLENLRQIKIRFCHKLKYVFPLSIARGLTRLRSIEILDCNEMEGILYKNEVDDNINNHYFSVEELHLHGLPKLVGFLIHNDDTTHEVCDNNLSNVDDTANQSSTTNNEDDTFYEVYEDVTTNQSWTTNNEDDTIHEVCDDELSNADATTNLSLTANNEDDTFYEVYDDELSNVHVAANQSLTTNTKVSSIKNKAVISDMEIYCAFSSKLMEKGLENLEKLKVTFCDALKVMFSFNGKQTAIGVFNSLKELELYGLRNLVHIWSPIPQEINGFQNLQLIILSECQNSYVLSPQVAKLLVQLQKLHISRCEMMKEIVRKEDDIEAEAMMDKIVFPQLKALELQYMLNLTIFHSGICAIEFPLLESLKINQCNKMESFSYGSLNMPMLKRVQINESFRSSTADLNAIMKSSNQ